MRLKHKVLEEVSRSGSIWEGKGMGRCRLTTYCVTVSMRPLMVMILIARIAGKCDLSPRPAPAHCAGPSCLGSSCSWRCGTNQGPTALCSRLWATWSPRGRGERRPQARRVGARVQTARKKSKTCCRNCQSCRWRGRASGRRAHGAGTYAGKCDAWGQSGAQVPGGVRHPHPLQL